MSEPSTITTVLKEATEGILSEEALKEIENAFNESVNERVKLHVDKALTEQDEDHATKLEKLLEAIDHDHTKKLKRLVRAINKDHFGKLKNVVSKYNGAVNEEAQEFKQSLVDNLSNYLDLYIERAIPDADIKQAMNNKQAFTVLEQLRDVLSVSDACTKPKVKEAIKQGKNQIDQLHEQLKTVNKEKSAIFTELQTLQTQLMLEKKTHNFSEAKKKYIYRMLSDKSPEFINENFDYTVKLLDKTEEERLTTIREDAVKTKQVVDRPTKTQVVTESDEETPVIQEGLLTNYMEELKRS